MDDCLANGEVIINSEPTYPDPTYPQPSCPASSVPAVSLTDEAAGPALEPPPSQILPARASCDQTPCS